MYKTIKGIKKSANNNINSKHQQNRRLCTISYNLPVEGGAYARFAGADSVLVHLHTVRLIVNPKGVLQSTITQMYMTITKFENNTNFFSLHVKAKERQ